MTKTQLNSNRSQVSVNREYETEKRLTRRGELAKLIGRT